MNTQPPQQTSVAPAPTATGTAASVPVPQPPRVPPAPTTVGGPAQRCTICGKTQAMGGGAQSIPGATFAGGFAPGGFAPGGFGGGGCYCGPSMSAPGFNAGFGGGGFSGGMNLAMPTPQMPGFGFNFQGPSFAAPQFGFQGPTMQQAMMGGPMMMPAQPPMMGGGMPMAGGMQAGFNPYDPKSNAYADAYAMVRNKGRNRAMSWALSGGLTGSLLVVGLFFFFQWWNGPSEKEPAENTPGVVQQDVPQGIVPGTNAGGANFSWVNPTGLPANTGGPLQSGLPGTTNQQSKQYPGLPVVYLRGGFGWFVAEAQRIVYVAHDAPMDAQLSARAFVQDRQSKGEMWRIVVVGATAASTEPAGLPIGSGVPGNTVPNVDGTQLLSTTERRKLLELLLDAKKHAETIRTKIRGETQLRYHLTPQHHEQLTPDLDGSVSSIDEAIGMLRGEGNK